VHSGHGWRQQRCEPQGRTDAQAAAAAAAERYWAIWRRGCISSRRACGQGSSS
jgi:hypothetical protein